MGKTLSPLETRKQEVVQSEDVLNDMLLKDIEKEATFLDELKKAEGLHTDIMTEEEALIKIYNEQMQSLCRLRCDFALYTAGEQVNFKEFHTQKEKTKELLEARRMNVALVREQLVKKAIAKKAIKELIK